MASPMTLLEGGLVFDRAGQALITAEPDAISIVDLRAGGATTRLAIRDARAVAAFADQLWIATHDDQLVRVDHAGRPLGPPRALPFAARAVLEPAPWGPAAAVWSSTPALALLDERGQLTATELADVELALPLTGRRFVTARGARLTLPSGRVTMLAPGTTVLGGAVMSDGRSVTLLVALGGRRQLIGVSLGTGEVAVRCATPSSTIRLATRRNLALALSEPRLIRILDLRAGGELGTVRFGDDVDDFAVDPDGQRLAVRCGLGAIELHCIADRVRRRARDMVSELAANQADTSGSEDAITINLRRRPRLWPGPRPASEPAPAAPEPVEPDAPGAGGNDAEVITSARRVEPWVAAAVGDELGRFIADARRIRALAAGMRAIGPAASALGDLGAE